MSNLRDLSLNAAKARRSAFRKNYLQSSVWNAILWKNWKGYSRWEKEQAIREAYERNGPYYAAANIIASTIAEVPIYVEYKVRGQTDHTTSHPILSALERHGSREEMIEAITLYLVVTGETYGKIILSPSTKKPLGIIPLPSQLVTPVQGDALSPILYFELQSQEVQRIPVNEMVYIYKPNLRNPFTGMSPAVPFSETIDLHNAGITWNKNIALNGGVPPIIASGPTGMGPEEAKEIADGYMEQRGAANSHRLTVLAGELEIQNLGTNPHDAEWERAILIAMRMILMGLGVSSSLMNDAANKTYNNVKDSRKALYLDACLPLANRIYKKISLSMRQYYDDNPIIKVDRDSIEALQEDKKSQAEWLSELKLSGIISANEARSVAKWPKSNSESADLLETSKEPSPVKPPADPVNANRE